MEYIKIEGIDGMGAMERAEKISRELFYLSRPIEVREQTDRTQYLFDWVKVNGFCFLVADPEMIIPVHPEKNLSNLMLLFPDMSDNVKTQLSAFIDSQQQFKFKYIIPPDATFATGDELALINKTINEKP